MDTDVSKQSATKMSSDLHLAILLSEFVTNNI